ncbi:hypothetical protein BKA70DRAFT_1421345 [Coprinopsis sp. MPI-PUGE-AT-0042]|nr:hypothetical protein BKA70DRAFT_1421345 [Coprinopsis sp. MPI-PUGE-AT-0042]
MTMLEPTYETISLPTTPEPPSDVPEFRRDDDYFFDTILFKVTDVGFRLPAYPFVQESDTFVSQYNLNLDGQENRTAVELIDIEVDDFKNFLKVLLPKHSRYGAQPRVTTVEWLSTLKLASKWHFNDLRKVAIAELSQTALGPIEQICLAREHYVSAWLLEGYEGLVHRGTGITEGEAETIGWRTALRLSAIVVANARRCPHMELNPLPVCDVVLSEFGAEVKDIRTMSEQYLTKNERRAVEEAAKLEAANEDMVRERQKQAADRALAQKQAQALREEMVKLQQKLAEAEAETGLQVDDFKYDSEGDIQGGRRSAPAIPVEHPIPMHTWPLAPHSPARVEWTPAPPSPTQGIRTSSTPLPQILTTHILRPVSPTVMAPGSRPASPAPVKKKKKKEKMPSMKVAE